MTTHTRRYIFLDFETLKNIKFKKLEKICDKAFVFIGSEIESVPFPLVKDMQRMGANVKWVEASGTALHDLNYHICFLLGKLHEKISSDVEFAVLSNDMAFDPLVNFINSTGRSCLRIRQQSMSTDTPQAPPQSPRVLGVNHSEPIVEPKRDIKLEKIEKPADLVSRLYGERSSESAVSSGESISDPVLIDETAKETVRRLIRSGNRPGDIHLLKSYILLHNQELSIHGNAEKIIKKMVESNDIRLNEEQVVYNF